MTNWTVASSSVLVIIEVLSVEWSLDVCVGMIATGSSALVVAAYIVELCTPGVSSTVTVLVQMPGQLFEGLSFTHVHVGDTLTTLVNGKQSVACGCIGKPDDSLASQSQLFSVVSRLNTLLQLLPVQSVSAPCIRSI